MDADPGPARAQPPIELGWLLVGDPAEPRATAVRDARDLLRASLAADFPEFRWEMPLVDAADLARDADEPAALLQRGAVERDARAWDFALVVTPHDLRSYYQSHALAVPSRALAVAVLSPARLSAPGAGDAERLARRIAALARHLFGDLNGLWHREAPDAVMDPPTSVQELDAERGFDERERASLLQQLHEVADLRLEETPAPSGALRFYLRASLERAGEIGSAVLQARPWELPLRLSRLTTAAMSALFVLVLTAEVWDLGTGQPAARMALLSAGVIASTTVFLLRRQRLLLRRAARGATEQAVVTNVSATLVVLLGLLTTYALLFLLTLCIGWFFFSAALIARWAPGLGPGAGVLDLLPLAALVASLGLAIGSLGASLEGEHYIRHVIYADEET